MTLLSIAQLKDDQSVQNQYGYSPYGVTVKGNAGVVDSAVDDKGNTSQYTGRENDGTGLYYNRARYFMASCGRFISEDPIGLRGGQANLYAYVGGDPLNAADPMGLSACDVQSALRAAYERFPDLQAPTQFTYNIPATSNIAGLTTYTRSAPNVRPSYSKIDLNMQYLPDNLPDYLANDLPRVIIHELMHANGFPSAPNHNTPTLEEQRRNDPGFMAEQDRRTDAIRARYEALRGQCP